MTSEGGWYPVALSAGLEPETSTGTRLFGHELVVWRDGAGASHVWEDRCPHRGMRLSFGFVRADRIACLYHGWQFDAAGRCRLIPAHPRLDVPETIQVTRFAAIERLGIVWVSLDGQGGTDPPAGDDAQTTAVRSIAVTAPAAAVVIAIGAEPARPGEGPFETSRRGALVRLTHADAAVIVALQPLSAEETCLHVLIAGERAEERASISTWAEAVRRRAEAR